MNALVLSVLIVIIIVLLYIVYVYLTSGTVTLASLAYLNTSNPQIPINDTPTATSYSYGVWIYVNSWNQLQTKLFTATDNNGTELFNLSLDGKNFNLYNNIRIIPQGGTATLQNTIITTNFPIQKWVCIIVSVDGTVVDCYLDGKLVVSTMLNGAQVTPNGAVNLTLANNSDTYLSNFQRWKTVTDPQAAWNYYMNGNGQGSTALGNLKGEFVYTHNLWSSKTRLF
jgi:hypothetical protein